MTLEAVFGLFGFFSGFLLHIFLLSVVLRRRNGGSLENALPACLLLWYGGNFLSLLLRQMNLTRIEL